ncbi:MAG: magnesium/cobalt transporter CorA, partial [Bdellovibrionales bacterium]|nr:magnesium/cobalt transporter CorA [Bdellovibrionales bacterium]
EPGAAVYMGSHSQEKTRIRVMEFAPGTELSTKDVRVEEMTLERTLGLTRWYDIVGLSDVKSIQKIGEIFKLHPLLVEDILNTDQRPKVEEGEHFIALFMRMVQMGSERTKTKLEHVCLAWGEGWVLLFQEDEGDLFDSVRNRIRSGHARICSSGADFLAYNLIDTMVDHYFFILENKVEAIERLEEKLLSEDSAVKRQEIYALRSDMLTTRRQIWPVREIVSHLVRMESPLIQAQTRFYLRDVYDHCVEIIDSIENLRETLASLAEVQLSSLTHKMNSVMMVLTVIATIFMPLTFISSIYGMNFKYMPEIDWEYGYPASLSLMLVVAIGMLIWFRRRKWI